MNLFEKITFHYKVITNFRPYLKKKPKNMDYLEIISENIDENIVSIYESLLNFPPNKYKKDKDRFVTYKNKIYEHNKQVELINQTVKSWNFKEILENPYSISNEYFSECANVAELLKNYTNLSEEHISFQKQIESVKDDYDLICSEFDIFSEFNALLDLSNYGYISHAQKEEIISNTNDIMQKYGTEEISYYKIADNASIKEIIKNHNDLYLDKAINLPLLDNINGYSLDKEQRKAILTNEDSVLVVAGAGSGKTLTICGKVEYLIKEKNIDPNDILVLSYSKKSANDLQSKISTINEEIRVGTFHKIGLDILKETQNKEFMVEDQYKAIIEQYFREEMEKRPEVFRQILTYYSLFLYSIKKEKKYTNEGELFEDLLKSDFTTLKNQLISLTGDYYARETLKKEFVKSYEEMAIANWYFINGIDYIYEAPYEIEISSNHRRQYMPDFKLKNHPIYHEHYGIDEHHRATQFSDKEEKEYLDGIKWKRGIHKKHRTDCIETYSYEFDDGIIFEKLEKELKERGVEFNPLSTDEINNVFNSIYKSKDFTSFINLVRTFLSLYKAKYRDENGFEVMKNHSFRNNYEKNRAILFLDIVKDIYHYYNGYLASTGKIDFDDMILQSMEEIDNTSHFKFKYIIVDEFQDISFSRMKLLKKLIDHGNSKLFAVGDDWQAIYRFSGCDINIFLKFSDFFDYSEIKYITTTHRNSQELQDIMVPFILTNPEQFKKSINSNIHLENPIQIIYYTEKKHRAFLTVLEEISKKDKCASVLLLGRNNRDLEDIIIKNQIYKDYSHSNESETVIKCRRFPKLKLTFSTVHGAKGLEDDYVIVINADDNVTGFPNKTEDDELLNLVLSNKSGYEYAEERRLWYVALTRSRKFTYIIANSKKPSRFLVEIESQCFVINPTQKKDTEIEGVTCPSCKSGRLILRKSENSKNKFYGCSNYPYCKYTINDIRAVKRNKRCKKCGDIMIYRTGQWGAFYGCNSYPECTYTENYNKKNKK